MDANKMPKENLSKLFAWLCLPQTVAVPHIPVKDQTWKNVFATLEHWDCSSSPSSVKELEVNVYFFSYFPAEYCLV